MEILKIKDWIKVKNQQFILTKKILSYDLECIRIKDNKKFTIGNSIVENKILIANEIYTIQVYIGKLDLDLIHVIVCGNVKNLNADVFVSQKMPINDVETFAETIAIAVRVRLISLSTKAVS